MRIAFIFHWHFNMQRPHHWVKEASHRGHEVDVYTPGKLPWRPLRVPYDYATRVISQRPVTLQRIINRIVGPKSPVVQRMQANARKASQTDWQLHTLSQLLGGMDNRRIVDVGCGWGNFLLMARAEGAEVAGCDLSPEACEFAKNRLGLSVHQSDLDSCLSAMGNIDAVVMRDFIEHPVNPLNEIQAAYNILKPGGLLLLYTPNGGDAGTSVETGKNWVGFRVDLEHLQYLSPNIVSWLSRKFDMSIERLEVFGYPGLKGIDELPKLPPRTARWAVELAKRIPGMRKSVQALRTLRAKVTGAYCDPRLGSYLLFAVLRKV